MINNYYDYRNISSFASGMTPSFVNVIKPKKTFTSKILSKGSLNGLNGIINGAQKIIKIYDQAVPIINQTKPMIDNIKTTFKVARAFKKISNESTLEKAFDNLPDYEPEKPKEEIKVQSNDEQTIAKPFYP